MKNIIYNICIGVLLASFVIPAEAQTRKTSKTTQTAQTAQTSIYEGQIPFKIQRLRQMDDSVYLVVDFDLKDLKISTDRSLALTPVLLDGKDNEYTLDNITINGRQRHKAFMREVQLNGWEKEVAASHYAVVDLKKNRKVLRYRQTVPFENWMRDARLDVRTDLCGCAGHVQQLGDEKLANRIIMQDAKVYRPLANVSYLTPPVEQVKARSESHNVFLDFPVARTEINPRYMNNPRELSRIENIIGQLRSDRNLRVQRVMITGFASPEGDLNFNNQLSRGRAEALRNYLSQRVGIPPQLYQLGFGGEDWNGLARLVQNSYIEPKGAILNIIHNTSGEFRKQQLKLLGGGQVYQRLLHGLYPQLRRVVARIDYNVKGFNVEEARQVIKTRPQQLSLNEMYILANTYEEGSKPFMEIFETAIRYFPNDPVANLNSAATALLQHDTANAERFLQKAAGSQQSSVRTSPEYYNNLGVMEMLKGNYPRARTLFNRAAEGKLEAAFKNLDELKKKEESDKQFK